MADKTKWRVSWTERNGKMRHEEFDSYADACRAAVDIPTQSINQLSSVTITAHRGEPTA